jgi:hypothetical protein
VLATHSYSAFPGLCISLLVSGDLDSHNPGQRSVLKSCDYLLHGAVEKYVAYRGGPPPATYHMNPALVQSGSGPQIKQSISNPQPAAPGGN